MKASKPSPWNTEEAGVAEFKKLQRVRYTSDVMHHLKGRIGTVFDITPRGWVEVQFDGDSHMTRCAQANLEHFDPRKDLLDRLFNLMTEYLTDECPDDQNWEDFDPDIDGLRSQVSDLGGGL
jgi:hypothetical protein